jgi:hypothetical protein
MQGPCYGLRDYRAAAREKSPEFSDAKRAALRFAQAAGKAPNAVTDADFAELRRHFDEDEILEIVAVIAYGMNIIDSWRMNVEVMSEEEKERRRKAANKALARGWRQ